MIRCHLSTRRRARAFNRLCKGAVLCVLIMACLNYAASGPVEGSRPDARSVLSRLFSENAEVRTQARENGEKLAAYLLWESAPSEEKCVENLRRELVLPLERRIARDEKSRAREAIALYTAVKGMTRREWALRESLRWALRVQDEGQRNTALRSLADYWALYDYDRADEVLSKLVPIDEARKAREYLAFRRELKGRIESTDSFPEVVEWAKAVPTAALRRTALREVVTKWVAEKPLGLAAAMSADPSLPVDDICLSRVARTYLEHDERKAVEWAEGLGPRREKALAYLAAYVVKQDKEKALELVGRVKNPDLTPQPWLLIGYYWAEKDVGAATKWAADLEGGCRDWARAGISWALIDTDLGRAEKMLAPVSNEMAIDFVLPQIAHAISKTPGVNAATEIRRLEKTFGATDDYSALLRQWAAEEPAAAARWITKIQNWVDRIYAIHIVSEAWARSSAQEALAWARQQQDERDRYAATSCIGKYMARTDRGEFWRLLTEGSGVSEADVLFRELAIHSTESAPSLAWSAFQRIENDHMRAGTGWIVARGLGRTDPHRTYLWVSTFENGPLVKSHLFLGLAQGVSGGF